MSPWQIKKHAQWERFKAAVPGASLSRSGRGKDTYIIGCSLGDFEARAILGTPQFPALQVQGKPVRPLVDMTDAILDDVIAAWSTGHKLHLPDEFDPHKRSAVDYTALKHTRAAEKRQRTMTRTVTGPKQ